MTLEELSLTELLVVYKDALIRLAISNTLEEWDYVAEIEQEIKERIEELEKPQY